MNNLNTPNIVTPQKEGSNRRSLKENPFYFGHFLNMAMHNAYKIMVHLTEKHLKEVGKIEEGTLGTSPLLNAGNFKPIEKTAISNDLKRHFPFVAYLNNRKDDLKPIELNFEDVRQNVRDALFMLNQLRNNYSHYANVKPIKELEGKEVKGNVRFEMLKIYEYGYGKLEKRYSHEEKVFKEEHIKHLSLENNTHSPVDIRTASPSDNYYEKSLAFFTCLFLEPAEASVFLSRLFSFKNTTTPEYRATRALYTMFCCRPPARKLESADIVLDMLNELGRVPKSLFKVLSEADIQTLMENEDKRIVNETETEEQNRNKIKRNQDRFPYFALRYFDDAQKDGKRFLGDVYFQIHLGKYLKKPEYEKQTSDGTTTRQLLADIHSFGNLSHFRNMYDALNQDDLKGKVKVIEKEGLFTPNWSIENGKKLRPEIIQFSPRYNFGENTIPFLLKGKDMTIETLPDLQVSEKKKVKLSSNQLKPTAIISTHELQNLFFYQYLHHKKLIKENVFFFLQKNIGKISRLIKDVQSGSFKLEDTYKSYQKHLKEPTKGRDEKYEAFQLRLQKFKTQEAENQALIEKRRKDLSQKIEKKYGIKRTALPDSLTEFLLGYAPPQYLDLVKVKLERQKKDVEKRLKKMGEAIKKKVYRQSKKKAKEPIKRYPDLGEIATYLADDIVFLMPHRDYKFDENKESVQQKINNDQFRELQSLLAMFGGEKAKIKKYFEELKLTQRDSKTRHPFLNRIDVEKCSGIIDFYTSYLKEKEAFIGEIEAFLKENKYKEAAIRAKYGYIFPIKIKAAKDKKFDNFPICLPRGIFREPIIQALKNHKPKLDLKDKDNVVHALSKYMDSETQDFYGNQHFVKPYDTETNTEGVAVEVQDFLKNLNLEIAEVEKNYKSALAKRHETAKFEGKKSTKTTDAKDEELDEKYKLNDLKQQFMRTIEHEKSIRFEQSNDRALWLMASDLLQQKHPEIEEIETFKLSQLAEVLDSKIVVKEKKSDFTITSATDSEEEQLRIKNYGRFRSLLKDRRISEEGLLYYFEKDKALTYNQLKTELKRYDQRREDFSELIYQFEKNVLDNAALKSKFPLFDTLDSKDNKMKYNHFNFMKNYGITKKTQDDLRDYFDHETFAAIASETIENETLRNKYLTEIVKLRNKIFHNQFPAEFEDSGIKYMTWLKAEVLAQKGDSDKLITDCVFDIAERYYEDLIEKVKAPELVES